MRILDLSLNSIRALPAEVVTLTNLQVHAFSALSVKVACVGEMLNSHEGIRI